MLSSFLKLWHELLTLISYHSPDVCILCVVLPTSFLLLLICAFSFYFLVSLEQRYTN